ncbi:hypothetical protein GCM10009619_12930 [Williamsia maris]
MGEPGGEVVTASAYVGGSAGGSARTDVRAPTPNREVSRHKLPAGNNMVELAIIPGTVCIVMVTRFIRGFQPDPPGLKRDDPGLLPPWPGSSPFPDLFVRPHSAHADRNNRIH